MTEIELEPIFVGKAIAPPKLLKKFVARLPERDSEETILKEAHNDDESHQSLAFWIKYLDAAENESERDILVRKVYVDNWGCRVIALCYKRTELRTFKSDRIKEMYWLDTGEIIDEPDTFLRNLHTGDPLEVALKNFKNELIILSFIARCDGTLCPEEAELMADFIEWHTPSQLPRKQLVERMRALFPAEYDVKKAARLTRTLPRERKTALYKYIRRIVDADKTIHEGEFKWITDLKEFLPKL